MDSPLSPHMVLHWASSWPIRSEGMDSALSPGVGRDHRGRAREPTTMDTEPLLGVCGIYLFLPTSKALWALVLPNLAKTSAP